MPQNPGWLVSVRSSRQHRTPSKQPPVSRMRSILHSTRSNVNAAHTAAETHVSERVGNIPEPGASRTE